MKKRKIVLLLFIAVSIVSGCLEEIIPPSITGELNETGEMLIYFEEQGDFQNSSLAPALIEAQEVFDNIENYLIIDLRDNDEFLSGHIQNSINVSSDSLYQFFNELEDSIYSKIVLVSKNGQSSAYFTCLLRLAGYNNIYTLNYGLASWHNDFADEWFDAIGNDSQIFNYNNDPYPMNDFTNLPGQIPGRGNQTLEEYINKKISNTISYGFIDEVIYRQKLVILQNDYPICYGGAVRLYFARRIGVLAERGHAERVIFYRSDPSYDLRSINNLQTLPTDRKILIYGATGQLSAYIVAYLRILGYDAATILFGVNQLVYSRILDDPEINGIAFTPAKIMNFDYVVGD